MTSSPVDALQTALDAAERIVVNVREDQWDAPTPCDEWNARQLVNHLVVGNHLFAYVLRDESSERARGHEILQSGREPVAAFHESALDVLAAFREPGALDKIVAVPAGRVPGAVALHLRITEALVHGWDLARAPGQSTADLPGELAEREIRFSEEALRNLPPDRTPFAASQPVADNAPAIDRLAALLGRSVSD
jgi:uncharacterized protein (TIGR03086 family)